jgi:hypothetical protein
MSNLNKVATKPAPAAAAPAKPAPLWVRATIDAIYDPEQRLWIDQMRGVEVEDTAFIQGHLESNALEIVSGA